MAYGRVFGGQEAKSSAFSFRKRQWRIAQPRSVPAWEKEFCFVIGRMRWKDFLKAKKNVGELDKVMRWDDSAGKECFDIGKSRFWARTGGSPCNLLLPGPDMYIDKVDWNTKIDPQLVMQLDDFNYYN